VVSSVGVWCVMYMVVSEMMVKTVKSVSRIVVFCGFFMFSLRPMFYAIEVRVLSKMLCFLSVVFVIENF